MTDHHLIAALRDALAGLYSDEASARRVCRDAGLDVRRIAFSTHAINNWTAILDEADKQSAISDIVAVARREYPRYPPLLNAVTALAPAVPAVASMTSPAATPASSTPPPPTGATTSYLFLSYSRTDQDYVRRLAVDLQAHGFAVWFDDQIDLGDRWWRTIVQAIKSCAAVVAVMSPEAEDSTWVEREILLAQQEQKAILPLLLRGKGLPLLINQQYADVSRGRLPPDAFYVRLRAAVARADGTPDAPALATNERTPSMTTPPSAGTLDRDLPPAAGPAITTAQKMALVKALLDCTVMNDRQSRAAMVEELPPGIRFNIRRSARDREDVNAIVTAALNYPDGLDRLLELVRFFEEDSLGMRGVDVVLVGMGLASLIPGGAPPSSAGAAPASKTSPVTVPATARRTAAVEVEPTPVPRPPTTPIAFDWVEIPAGEFIMGSDPQRDKGARWDDEKPQHRLTLPVFWITRVPVTVAQFAAFVTATHHRTAAEKQGYGWIWGGSAWEKKEGASWLAPGGPDSNVVQKQNHPVTQVSWHDAMAFCRWAGVKLPSEAEWEKAARGTDGRIYPWDDTPPDKNRCNFGMNVKDTTPVGQYPAGASPYGLLDMSGNVWEWTRSLWGKEQNKPAFVYRYDPNDGREDLSAPDGVRRVLRGGSWVDSADLVRCASRGHYGPWSRNGNVGFRLVAPGL